jgi:plastocyanin
VNSWRRWVCVSRPRRSVSSLRTAAERIDSVVSTTQAFISPRLKTDETYSYKFTRAGEYEYFCDIHPLMVGKVVVK